MIITIDTTQLQRVAAGLGFSDRRMRAVAASALTAAARDVERNWLGQLSGRLDRPTPLTTRAAVVQQATAARPVATVKLRDLAPDGGLAPADYLLPQERGGARGLKKFERALQTAGALPAGYRAVPGPAARLDGYGNVSRGQIVEVLNQLVGAGALSPGYRKVISARAAKRKAAARRAGRQYLAITERRAGGLPMGIYHRLQGIARRARTVRGTMGALRLVFAFVRTVHYPKRLALLDEGLTTAQRVLGPHAERYLQQHIARLSASRG